jgi:hypothetical protein
MRPDFEASRRDLLPYSTDEHVDDFRVRLIFPVPVPIKRVEKLVRRDNPARAVKQSAEDDEFLPGQMDRPPVEANLAPLVVGNDPAEFRDRLPTGFAAFDHASTLAAGTLAAMCRREAGAGLAKHRYSRFACSRSTNFCTLPVEVFGSAPKMMVRGTL